MTIDLKPFAAIAFFLLLTATASAQPPNPGQGSTGNGGAGSTGGTSASGAAGASNVAGAGGSGLSGNSSFAGQVAGESTATSNAAQTFIGSNATQGFIGGATTAAALNLGANRQFQAIQNNQTQGNTTQQTGTPREIRTTLRIGFPFPSASQSQSAGRLANANVPALERFIPDRPELAAISVQLNPAGVVLLTGSASSLETSRLAANLMRLQPGVRKVDNQIIVPVN